MKKIKNIHVKREVNYTHPGRIFKPGEEPLPKDKRDLLLSTQYYGSGIDNFKEYIKQHEAGVILDVNNEIKTLPIKVTGLMSEFSRLNTEEDINRFAATYGLLNIVEENHGGELLKKYGFSIFEPISIWWDEIKKVRRLLRLYRAIKKRVVCGGDNEIEGKIFYFPKRSDMARWVDDDTPTLISYNTDTNTAQAGYRVIMEGEDPELITAIAILSHTIKEKMEEGVHLDFSDIRPSKTACAGFRITPHHSTFYLLAGIYFDLWRVISLQKEVITCQNPQCGLLFEKRGKRRYCSDSCRQQAFRISKKEADSNG